MKVINVHDVIWKTYKNIYKGKEPPKSYYPNIVTVNKLVAFIYN